MLAGVVNTEISLLQSLFEMLHMCYSFFVQVDLACWAGCDAHTVRICNK